MKLLIVGSGGREQAIAWKAAQSPLVQKLFVAPGNAGTSQSTGGIGENVPIDAVDIRSLVQFSKEQRIDLVIVGPESALEAGITDAMSREGLRVFGPSRAAARIETSKVFAKEFMVRHGFPTPRYARFSNYLRALDYLQTVKIPVVIKASGLAAGKGVILPESYEEAQIALRKIMVEGVFGSAGDEIIIEERIEGPEISLLAFSDGVTVCSMPAAQDHKRLLDGDLGPNTGGMGAYAPAPVCSAELSAQITDQILQKTVDGLRAEGTPYIGILYAGMMLTSQGPQVLEFNCRFGDPETQVILPLLESDLVEIVVACVEGHLEKVQPRWKNGSAACVVLASEGYPGRVGTGKIISGLESIQTGAISFHAGTKLVNSKTVSSGGRVLNITGTGETLNAALEQAYQAVSRVHFDGMQYRKDIAHQALKDQPVQPRLLYTESGVNIDAGNKAVELMRTAVQSTYTSSVLAGIGSFGGLFDATWIKKLEAPVLVASTDGVGTKVRLGAVTGRYAGLGEDIVNHCINDILVQGARPLFFLDYFATSHLEPEVTVQVVSGIAKACRESHCVLLGGETAEMPGVYAPGEFDVAGTIVGIVERDRILPKTNLQVGDVLVGIRSSGPHTNGFSLIRKIFKDVDLDKVFPELGVSLADALLVPHRSYLDVLLPILESGSSPIKALAHLTGGGFIENIPRILPAGLQAIIRLGSWPVPALFQLIQKYGQVPVDEMHRVFNMGIGMVAITAPEKVEDLRKIISDETWVIGELVKGSKGVQLR